MTTQTYRLKIARSNSLKLKMQSKFPAAINTGNFLKLTSANGIYTFDVDYSVLTPGPIIDPATAYVAIEDKTAGIYREVSLASLLTSGVDTDLQAIAALTGAGVLVRTADNTWSLRTVTGTANEITVTDGDGVSGNPIVSLPNTLTFTGKTVTGGTFQSPAINMPTGIVKGDVGLGNVDNTSDATKNAATATLTNKTLTAPVINSPTGLVKGDVGLGNVDNTSDATKNAATATLTNKTISGANNTLTVREADLSTSDVTTGNVSTTKHGFAPKLPNDATKYLDGTGNYSVPAGGGGVSSLSIPPLGRLTLASGVPVMSASQANKTTVYYTPYAGNLVPIYDGTNMVPTAFSELSQATTDTTKSPAAVAASNIYDLFVWNDGGTIRCTRGPAWTNSTTRGYTFTMVNGILLNTSAITNGPAASRGTWVGTIASNASSAIDFIFGGIGSNGVAGVFNVWNAYNRVNVGCMVVDNSASYTYSSTTVRQAHGSSTMQVSFVNGAQEDAAQLSYQIYIVIAAGFARGGIGLDSTTVYSAYSYVLNNQVSTTILPWNAPIGTHTVTALESGDGTNSETFNQNGTANLIGLSFAFRM